MGLETLARTADGAIYTVHNIVWGYDAGDGWAHISTNSSPTVDQCPVDFFFTDEISCRTDPEGKMLYENLSPSTRLT